MLLIRLGPNAVSKFCPPLPKHYKNAPDHTGHNLWAMNHQPQLVYKACSDAMSGCELQSRIVKRDQPSSTESSGSAPSSVVNAVTQ
jgi:hypothetical protein